MYGLPQAGKIAHEALIKHLEPYGYTPCRLTPGLWKHHTRPITFTLVVNDFGIKYVGKEHAEHLFNALSQRYQVTADWTGSLYLGVTLKWDYKRGTVDLSMPDYIQAALDKFQHPPPPRPEDSPYPAPYTKYGPDSQLTAPVDETERLDAAAINRLQQFIGTLLYYSRAVDPIMVKALGSLATQQTAATETTAKRMTHPDATLRFTKSGMILHISSDAFYLSEPNARSCVGGHFFMADLPPKDGIPAPKLNGPVHIVSNIVQNVMSSTGEAEVAGLFHNLKDGVMLRNALIKMGHEQPATPVQTDNSFAEGFANKTVKQRRSKAIDMRFYWVQDRVAQGQFHIYWQKGASNLADYFTKHHPARHHRFMRKNYLLDLHRANFAYAKFVN